MSSSKPLKSTCIITNMYPTVEECKIRNLLRCTEAGCQNVFASDSNLTLHLAKTHKKTYLMETDGCIKHYFCPEAGCIHNTEKYFQSLKDLRQHYLKVHSPKEFKCTECQNSFVSENFLKNHKEYCCVTFFCLDCSGSYHCYETLKTHGRRKKHKVLPKQQYKSKVESNVKSVDKYRFILPKVSVVNLLNEKFVNQESQTVSDKPKVKCKMTQVSRHVEVPQRSRYTQTGSNHDGLTVETQTIGDFINVPRKFDILNYGVEQKSSKTQTDVIESKSTSCNTSFNLVDLESSNRTDIPMNSSGTQTLVALEIYSTSTTTHDSTHTDTSDLEVYPLNDAITNFEFDNCHIETQTDFIFKDVMFGCDYMSNMYTQTCDEILPDFTFSDIQTQTAFDDALRSVESQTLMSHDKRDLGCRDMTHMETQTDAEFRQMLEVINS